jgi:endonuclease VIII
MEGPSLLIIKEDLKPLKGKRITSARGLAKIDYTKLTGQKIKSIKTFGKHLLIEIGNFNIRIHFLMFGSYRINERRDREAKLSLNAGGIEVNFYSCAITFLEDDLDSIYDWTADVLSDAWSTGKARNKLKKNSSSTIGDLLLDQTIFAGVGNIIRNEVLYRALTHPDSTINAIPPRKLTEIINEARLYSFDFLRWKKAFVLKKNWLIYKKKKCKLCKGIVVKRYTGTTKRRCFICENCQVLYEV